MVKQIDTPKMVELKLTPLIEITVTLHMYIGMFRFYSVQSKSSMVLTVVILVRTKSAGEGRRSNGILGLCNELPGPSVQQTLAAWACFFLR